MMIALYQQHDSGNCSKVRLVLTHLRLSFQTIAVSSVDGSTRRPDSRRQGFFGAFDPGFSTMAVAQRKPPTASLAFTTRL